jgi:4-diphosphocytidyl-2-C-methyl-D-erythritol kinase
VIIFPNCKINLGLNIIRKRKDGFHDIETVFYPLSIHDAIEVIEASENTSPIHFTSSGKLIHDAHEKNICVRAYHLLKKDFPDLPPVKMHLLKNIPLGAGLGGGSSDGAFTLKLLNQKFNLKLTTEKLIGYALQLGSDCPFFIINKPCFATGRGEIMEEIKINLRKYKFIIVYPCIHCSTVKAFSNIAPVFSEKSIKQIIQQPVQTWKDELKNDFENSVFAQHPEVKKIKDELYKKGALYASMTGSGSSVYGIFKSETSIQFSFPKNYFVKELFSQLQ